MKHISLSAPYTKQRRPMPTIHSEEQQKACFHGKNRDLFSLKSTPCHYAPDSVLAPSHLNLHLDFDVANKSVMGKVIMTVKNNKQSKSNTRTLQLNAVAFQSVQVNQTFTYDGKVISIAWDHEFDVQEERTVIIEYKVSHPVAGLYFDVPNASFPDRVLHAITDNETERARYWLPCVDFPAIRTSLEFTLTCSSDMNAFANGHLVSDQIKDSKRIIQYKCDFLCPSYLICVAVGKFHTIQDESVDGIPIQYICPENLSTTDLKASFAKTPKMISWIQNKLNYKFPWPKYYQIASKFIGGAMENISLVTWSDLYVLDPVLIKERGLGVELTNIHEMAHTYFGDLLVIRHFEHVWLKESWATYFEALWLQDTWNEDEFRYEMYENATRYLNETERYVRPLVTRQYEHSWALFDSHTYPGGGWRIHMLRHVVGEDCFWKGVSNYVKSFANKVVETEDFRKCLEHASGLNLTRFFDQWFYSLGYPKLKGNYSLDLEKQVAKIEFEQTQISSDEWGVFDFDLQVEWTDDQDHIHESVVEFKNTSKAFAAISLPKDVKIKTIRVDPHGKILHTLELDPGEDILYSTAQYGQDIVSRIWAFKGLIKIGSFSALGKLSSVLLKEPFYGVREKIALELAKMTNKHAYKIIGELLNAEKDPRAMYSIATSCRVQDDFIRLSLLNFLSFPQTLRQGIIPYRAHAAALESLAIQKNSQDVDYLLSAASDSNLIGQHGIIRAGAIRALGLVRDQKAFDHLLELALNPGSTHERARPWIFTSLASCAPWISPLHKKKAAEVLMANLSDENQAVRWRCILGLVALKEKSSIPAILASESLWDTRDFHDVLRQVRELKSVNDEGVMECCKQLEDLEKRIKELEFLNSSLKK